MIAFLIPAYKPTDRLTSVVSDLCANLDAGDRVVVVDDGCGPDYAAVFSRLAAMPQVNVLRNAVNLGKGAALKYGINYILTEGSKAIGIVTADADGQHAVLDIKRVGEMLRANPRAFVLGSREFGEKVPLRSKLGNSVSRVLYRLLLGLKLKDTQTGLRGMPLLLARNALSIHSNRYEFETEQLALSSSLGIEIVEIPIQTIYEDDNSSSHFDPFLDSLRIYFVVLRYTLSSILTWAVDVIALFLINATSSILAANLGSRAVAVGLQFYLLKAFVFRARAGLPRFLLFVLYVATMGIASATLQARLSEATGVGQALSKLLVESIIFIFNFLFLRNLFFRRTPQ
jgi:glycosyltransferase involved in cell wall biosynthesis